MQVKDSHCGALDDDRYLPTGASVRATGGGWCGTWLYSNWAQAVSSVSRKMTPPLPLHFPTTWCLSSGCHSASSWLMWCPAVIAGLVHLQTWTRGREYCVTAGPFMPDRVLLALLKRLLTHSPLLLLLIYLYSLATCVTMTSKGRLLLFETLISSVEPQTV